VRRKKRKKNPKSGFAQHTQTTILPASLRLESLRQEPLRLESPPRVSAHYTSPEGGKFFYQTTNSTWADKTKKQKKKHQSQIIGKFPQKS